MNSEKKKLKSANSRIGYSLVFQPVAHLKLKEILRISSVESFLREFSFSFHKIKIRKIYICDENIRSNTFTDFLSFGRFSFSHKLDIGRSLTSNFIAAVDKQKSHLRWKLNRIESVIMF